MVMKEGETKMVREEEQERRHIYEQHHEEQEAPQSASDVLLARLPIGYKFLPSDEEIVNIYLFNKAFHKPLPVDIIKDISADDLYSKPPFLFNYNTYWKNWERRFLRDEWFFFIHDNNNINIGSVDEDREIREVGDGRGFWKLDETSVTPVQSEEHGQVVHALKRCFTYYSGTISDPRRTDWTMEEHEITWTDEHNLNKDMESTMKELEIKMEEHSLETKKPKKYVLGRIRSDEWGKDDDFF